LRSSIGKREAHISPAAGFLVDMRAVARREMCGCGAALPYNEGVELNLTGVADVEPDRRALASRNRGASASGDNAAGRRTALNAVLLRLDEFDAGSLAASAYGRLALSQSGRLLYCVIIPVLDTYLNLQCPAAFIRC
jgi:hypothetical protein